tara:strand:+ start:173 stop:1273 length:1101 start_codon:yes stop_codon:yes gene_type:complete
MAVDFKTFMKVSKFICDVRKPVLLRGRHGIGKSEVVYQIADDMEMEVVERRASQMTEGDLVGLPVIEGDTTQFNPPDWFKQACREPVVLFLDEVDRATIEVRQGIFELTDSRKLNGHHLHPDTLIFAAVNGGEHSAQYQVGDMDPAELDRWTVFDVEPTIEDWLTWAKENVNPILWDFVNQNNNHLEHEGEFEPNKVYPSRRSWKRANDCMEKAELWADPKTQLDLMFELSRAFVGFEAAVALRDFVEKYDVALTPEDIINDGKWDKTKEWGINDHLALINKMDSVGILEEVSSLCGDVDSEDYPESQIENLVQYMVLLPSEAGQVFWMHIGKNQDLAIAVHRCQIDGKQPARDYVVQIFAGKVED